MMSSDCSAFDRDLAAFVDGELRGAKVHQVLDHLDYCAACTTKVNDLRELGECLRAEAPADPDPRAFDGLAGTVVSRTRAEAAESWRGLLTRASEDWHWVMVGAGAVAATFASTTLLSVLLAFGPRPERGDSLSALTWPQAGTLLAMPVGMDSRSVVMQVDDVGPMSSRAVVDVDFDDRNVDRTPTEAELVDALLGLVTRNGRSVALNSMGPKDRRAAERLLQDINRLRSSDPVQLANILNVRFEVFTSVSAKGL